MNFASFYQGWKLKNKMYICSTFLCVQKEKQKLTDVEWCMAGEILVPVTFWCNFSSVLDLFDYQGLVFKLIKEEPMSYCKLCYFDRSPSQECHGGPHP